MLGRLIGGNVVLGLNRGNYAESYARSRQYKDDGVHYFQVDLLAARERFVYQHGWKENKQMFWIKVFKQSFCAKGLQIYYIKNMWKDAKTLLT